MEMEMKVPIVCYCCSWLLSFRVCISLCVFSCDMLMWKYTKVHGCIRNKDEVYRASRRVGLLHKGAICHKLKYQECWVGTDEWTDEQGHASANVLIGVGPKVYVVATLQLRCKGPNQGVEHTENVLCFFSSIVGVQVRQRQCMRNIFVPRKHHRKSRKYHGNATENHGKSRKITENHGKSRKITEGVFQANHGNSRSPVDT